VLDRSHDADVGCAFADISHDIRCIGGATKEGSPHQDVSLSSHQQEGPSDRRDTYGYKVCGYLESPAGNSHFVELAIRRMAEDLARVVEFPMGSGTPTPHFIAFNLYSVNCVTSAE
jgi:hypothetical protein